MSEIFPDYAFEYDEFLFNVFFNGKCIAYLDAYQYKKHKGNVKNVLK